MRISEWQTLVMKNFDVPASASGPIRAPCTHCSTLIAGTTKTPANFLKHLKRKHLSIFLELTSLKKTIGTSPEDYSSKSSTSFEHKSSLSPKKAAYPVDFKIRVLEYFLKNGGEANFGLKSKTAQLFNVDKKTINRMLLNHELVSMVEKALESGKSHSSIHHNRKKSKPNKCKRMDSENNSRTSSPLLNAMSSDGNQDDVPILELPEDPDYSILKKTIRSSSNEVGNIVQILASGTREVQSVMLQECDLILECKVCKALFRSLVNLLAHKRIYCTDKFRNVRNSYEQTNALGVSSESSSEMVIASKPKKSRGIDQIAERLASKDNPACVSSSSDKGSPQFYRSLLKTQENRDKDKRTCSVVLTAIKNVKGVSSQDVTCGNKTVVTSQSQNILQQANERKQGATAVIGPDGNVVSSFFGDPKDEDAANEEISRLEAMEAEPRETDTSTSKRTDIRSVSQDEERDIYTCPICKSQFLSVGGCLKHLIKVHKKKKQHRETLRRIILERSYKRRLTPEEKSTSHLKASSSLEPPLKKICLSEPKTISTPDVDQSSIREPKPSTNYMNSCPKCKKNFMTGGALGSHVKHCAFPMSPLAMHDLPEKKIAIQIRKSYKKEGLTSPTHSSCSESFPQLLIRHSLSEDSSANDQQESFQKEFEHKFSKVSSSLKKKMKNGKVKCEPCKLVFSRKALFRAHVAKHLNCTRYLCGMCNKFRSYHRYTMINHLKVEHNIAQEKAEEFTLFAPKFGEFVFNLQRSPENNIQIKQEPEDDEPDLSKRIEPNFTVKTIRVNKVHVISGKDSPIVRTENSFEMVPKVKIERLDASTDSPSSSETEKLQHEIASNEARVSQQEKDVGQKSGDKDSEKKEEPKQDANANKLISELPLKAKESLTAALKLRKGIKITQIKTKEFVRSEHTKIIEKARVNKEDKIDNEKLEISSSSQEVQSSENLDPQDKQLKQDRPQRVRRVVEKKDFIYEVRKTVSPLSEEESNKNNDSQILEEKLKENSVEVKENAVNGCSAEKSEPISSDETATVP